MVMTWILFSCVSLSSCPLLSFVPFLFRSPRFPLESNPEVMNKYASNLGLDTSIYSFQDVLATEDWALEMVPKPVVGVVMLYPISPNQEAHRKEEGEKTQVVDPEGNKDQPRPNWISLCPSIYFYLFFWSSLLHEADSRQCVWHSWDSPCHNKWVITHRTIYAQIFIALIPMKYC